MAAKGFGTKDASKKGWIRGGRGRNKTPVCRNLDDSNTDLTPLEGGLAEGKNPKDFDKKQLDKGILIEMEHTNDPVVARRIAMDHLSEHKDYYRYLPKMEKRLTKKENKERKRQEKIERKKRGK